VTSGDDWQGLAQECHMDVGDLIYFNFGTRDPREVNWCLEKLVGCTQTTVDQRNYVFHQGARPGVVYLPDNRSKRLDEFLTKHGILARATWGARETKLTADPANLDWDYTTVVLHHSGRSGETDPRVIQSKHMDKNKWDDVGYHFMLGPAGQIYEGRRLIYKGSHTENANTGKIGILVMGNFEKEFFGFMGTVPSDAQLLKVKSLVNWLKEELFPLGTLGGHKDFKKGTECPGNQLYPLLDAIREATGLRPPL
jgi:hypothetical protein